MFISLVACIPRFMFLVLNILLWGSTCLKTFFLVDPKL